MKRILFFTTLFVLVILINIGTFKFLDILFMEYYKDNYEFNDNLNKEKQLYLPYIMYAPDKFKPAKIHNSIAYPGTDQYGFFLDSNDNKLRYLNNNCEYRVLMLGGSTVEGRGLKDYDDTIPARLEKLYQKHFNTKKIKVINAGVGGYYTGQEITRLIFYIMPHVKFDYVIFFHGGNDFENMPLVPFEGVGLNYHQYFLSLTATRASTNDMYSSLSYVLRNIALKSPLLYYLYDNINKVSTNQDVLSKFISNNYKTIENIKHDYPIHYWVDKHYKRYIYNIEIAQKILGSRATFILQPSMTSKDNLSKKEIDIFNEYEIASKGRFYSKPLFQAKIMFLESIKKYYIRAKRNNSSSDFIDMTTVFDNKSKAKTAYIDHVHFSSFGKKLLSYNIYSSTVSSLKIDGYLKRINANPKLIEGC